MIYKIPILTIAFLFLVVNVGIPTATAVDTTSILTTNEGRTISTASIMNEDFTIYTYAQLGCRVDNRASTVLSYKLTASCLTLQKIDANNVKVIRETYGIQFSVTDFLACVVSNGLKTCIRDHQNYLGNMLVDGAEKKRAKAIQVVESVSTVNPDWFAGVGFP